MSRALFARSLLSLLVAAGLALTGVQPMPQPTVNAATTPAATKSTLHVGMWTLWHDREMTLSAAGVGQKVALRTCDSCAVLSFAQPVDVKAAGDGLTLNSAGRTGNTQRVVLTGGATLAAHGETVTLGYAVTISARAGVLSIVVTLPVESYVERVIESESGPADSAESLKAFGHRGAYIRVARGPRARGLRSLRLDALPASALERESRAPCRGARSHTGHGRGDAVVPRPARTRLLQ